MEHGVDKVAQVLRASGSVSWQGKECGRERERERQKERKRAGPYPAVGGRNGRVHSAQDLEHQPAHVGSVESVLEGGHLVQNAAQGPYVGLVVVPAARTHDGGSEGTMLGGDGGETEKTRTRCATNGFSWHNSGLR